MGKVSRRFWKIGGLLALFLFTLAVGNFFAPADKAFTIRMYGHDFLPFYTAGQFVRSGRISDLYDPVATRLAEHQTCDQAGLVIHNEYGAFLNPPFAALPAAPLAAWPYRTALWFWTAILFAFLFGALALLIRMVPEPRDWRIWGLIPLLFFAFMPAWQAALHAQNTFISLFILAATVAFWRDGKALAAGLTAGLLLYKPQLGAVVAIVLIASLGRRALVGVAFTGIWMAILSSIALPGAMSDYVTRLPENLRAIQELPNYTWQRHITFLAWWRVLLQGHVGALPTLTTKTLAELCAVLIAGVLAPVTWKYRTDRTRRDRLIAATICSMPLLMPYFMDYDLCLLAVPAVLCAVEAGRNRLPRSVLWSWIGLFVAAEANATIAGSTRFIPDVPFLVMLSLSLIAWSNRPAVAEIEMERRSTEIKPPPRAMAA